MLLETLENTMAKAQKYEQITKATKFGNVYDNSASESENNFSEKIMRKKIDKYTKRGHRSFDKTETEEVVVSDIEDDFIVEDPHEVVFEITYTHSDLPFFRSIQEKLNKKAKLCNIK